MDLAADAAAHAADHRGACVDLRALAKTMGTQFQQEIERQVTATQRTHASPATLKISPGSPMNLFDPATWVACFVEFFYGDCVPNLERPAKISFRRLFRYLSNREELEYHLVGDKDDPLIPGKMYKGGAQSRWNIIYVAMEA